MSPASVLQRRTALVAITVIAIVALAALPQVISPFTLRIFLTIFFGAGLAIAWNILGGFAGYWSFGHAAFLGLGAFAGALFQEHVNLPASILFPLSLLLGGGTAGLFALIFGYPLLRLRGAYFAIAMLGVMLVLGELSGNVDVFEGALGIVLPPVQAYVAPEKFFYAIFLILALCAFGISVLIRYSRLGYGLIAIREDEDTARMMGIPTERYKLIAFIISATLTGIIGAAYAFSLGYITTDSVFRTDFSLDVIVYSLLGGMGTLLGPIVGAVIMTIVTQVLLGGLLQAHMLITGVILIALVFLLPDGLMGLRLKGAGVEKELLDTPEPRAANAGDGVQATSTTKFLPDHKHILLELKDLVMQFRGLRAIDGVSIQVPAHSISSIIGPNGAGKSTIFNMITGYLRPTAGEIRYDGERIDGVATHLLSQRGISRAFQISKPFQGLTVFENVYVAALFGAQDRGDPISITEDALALTGMNHLAKSRASILPAGHLRKLELARVVASRPRLVLADEPCAGLNPTESQEVVTILRRLRDRGATVLLVEHDMKTVMEVSDYIFVVAAGQPVAEGVPEDVVHNPKVIDVYLGQSRDRRQGTTDRHTPTDKDLAQANGSKR